jgi:hypothetical protein
VLRCGAGISSYINEGILMQYSNIIEKLKCNSVTFQEGLSKQEMLEVQEHYNIYFPPDLSRFLMTALPISNSFVNWRDVSTENIKNIKERLNWPLEGMIYDIEHNNFWYEEWGKKPDDLSEAIEICKREFQTVPKLIPTCSHRYIPSEPHENSNPVFSVHQTDIIYYGESLLSYLEIEFRIKKWKDMDFNSIKKIRFWDDLL